MKAIYVFLTLGSRLKAFLGLGGALGALSFVPGMGVAAGALTAVYNAIAGLIKAFFEGVSICLANPVVFTVIAATFGGGVWAGIDWDRHKVEKIRQQAATEVRVALARVENLEKELDFHVLQLMRTSQDAGAKADKPQSATELAALCAKDQRCRDRGRKP